MKHIQQLLPLTLLCFTLTATARYPPPSARHKTLENPAIKPNQQFLHPPQAAMPPSDIAAGVYISDVIGKTQDIAIFSSLTRDIDSVSGRLEDSSQNATVLAPSNSVMRSLPRKPWENPGDYGTYGSDAYSGQSGEDRAQANLRKFVEAHVVPVSPWTEGEKVKTLAGNEIWWEVRDGKKIINPGSVEVSSIADKVGNGEVWILNGVVNYQ
ncbi:hypothetical protein EJ05DRAFT_502173 [Pseudovirgaria hyperparasitica]|uniref:FAS1 domain-containing protein n=1 Tax=Pseudovirgaria hyperparasitica TaxID=470096 RepID=A0A6A6W3G5_9PEZI|nr:uncharacterized protein EJ05DRAFT_502173 [Pseudovirgaria hyperparasitica]KAF2756679.1 hypothetical protein EJ05DRAFT_502173 [Pseudovirgaria hyperparasitica]